MLLPVVVGCRESVAIKVEVVGENETRGAGEESEVEEEEVEEVEAGGG